jgi:stress-induced morphogen
MNAVSEEQICKCPTKYKVIIFSEKFPILKRQKKNKAIKNLLGLDNSELKIQQTNVELEGLFCKFKPVQTITF